MSLEQRAPAKEPYYLQQRKRRLTRLGEAVGDLNRRIGWMREVCGGLADVEERRPLTRAEAAWGAQLRREAEGLRAELAQLRREFGEVQQPILLKGMKVRGN